MSLILFGSHSSPFVRRIRLFMEGMDYQFRTVNIFEASDREHFRTISPIKKLPVLQEGDQLVFDSHVIYQYLRQKKGLPAASLEESNQVSVIDAILDSSVTLLLATRSELPVAEDRLLFRLQRERLPDSFEWLNREASRGAFDVWHYGTMCLIAMMDWLAFRALSGAEGYPALQAVRQRHEARPIVQATMPKG